MLNAEDIKMSETVAVLKKCVVRIGREGFEVERPFGRLAALPLSLALATQVHTA